jgi:L-ribulose-5-phosphate 3-epimerase
LVIAIFTFVKSGQATMANVEMIPVGIYEKALPPTLSWPERLATAARIGYDFVEISIDDSDERIARLDWSARQRAALQQAAADTGVPVMSMSLSAHRRYPLGSVDPGSRQTGLDILKKAIDFTVDVGLRFILIAGSDVYYEPSDDSTRARFLEGLAQGLEWASRAGVLLALENWDVPTVDSVQKAMRYVHHFGSPWFQHYPDIGNLAYVGHDVAAELEVGRGHIVAVHVKDTLPGQLRYVPLGEGIVPFVAIFAKLAALGFRGPVVLELWTEHDPRSVEIAADSCRWLRERMRQGWAQAQHNKPERNKGARATT